MPPATLPGEANLFDESGNRRPASCASAANGVRDPEALKATALSAVVECTHYSHDIGPARRIV